MRALHLGIIMIKFFLPFWKTILCLCLSVYLHIITLTTTHHPPHHHNHDHPSGLDRTADMITKKGYLCYFPVYF